MEQNNIRSRSVCQRDECSKTHLPLINSKNIISPKNNFTKTFFLPEKDKGDFYFRNTKVGSCRKIIVKNSLPLAMTFKIKNSRGEPLTHFNHTLKRIPKNTSSYFFDYCTPKTESHIGMKKKPLVPYNPHHDRNKLMDFCEFNLRKSLSSVNIGNENLVNRKQWVSTYKDSFKKFMIKRISNPGILSDLAKRTHYKFNNIEFS